MRWSSFPDRVYVRDSGLVHALLGLTTQRELLSHPVLGSSWEGWIIENLLACAPPNTQSSYYRTAVGAEIALLLDLMRELLVLRRATLS